LKTKGPLRGEYIKGKEFVIYILYIENSFHILYTPLSPLPLSLRERGEGRIGVLSLVVECIKKIGETQRGTFWGVMMKTLSLLSPPPAYYYNYVIII